MPMGLLLKEPRLFAPIPPLTWDERVQKAVEASITGVPNSRSPNHLSGGFKGGEQLYPEEDYNMLIIPERRSPPRGRLLQLALRKVSHRVPMSCHISVSKKRMGADRYMRREVEKRLRASLNYIVARGAYYDADVKRIKFNPEDAGRKWALQGTLLSTLVCSQREKLNGFCRLGILVLSFGRALQQTIWRINHFHSVVASEHQQTGHRYGK